MPRADKMRGDRKQFYWSDVGPVTAFIENGQIVRAEAVDPEIDDYEYNPTE